MSFAKIRDWIANSVKVIEFSITSFFAIIQSMVRTRIAPSPTGYPHIGTIYQALFNYSFSRKYKGQFIVRIEDTDRERFVADAESKFFAALDWFNLSEDESPRKPGKFAPYRQSERLSLYHKYAKDLVQNGHAYYCFCSKDRLERLRKKQAADKKPTMYDKHCRNLSNEEIKQKLKNKAPAVIRLKVPEQKKIIVKDEIRGNIEFDSSTIDDQVLLKSDGYPTYHLAVVVDDHLMQITHVLRGEEWLSSFPKHWLLYEFFGWRKPLFFHTPTLRNPDKSKLSKRHEHTNVSWYQKQGFLAKAILNYLALMGWSHPEEKEIFPLSEFIKYVELKDLSTVGPVFDLEKLRWLNGEYIRKSKTSDLKSKIIEYLQQYQKKQLPEDLLEKTIPLVQTRMKTLSEYWNLVSFIFERPQKIDFPTPYLKQVKNELLQAYKQIDWQHEKIYKITQSLADKKKIKPVKLYMEIRYALSNQKVTAPLFEGMEIMGKTEVLARLQSIK